MDQSPATLFLAASTDATHTKFLLPRHYTSSAVIRAAATPSYDGNCTAEIALSRYDIPLSTSTTAAPVARTTVTPDGIKADKTLTISTPNNVKGNTANST